MKSPMTAATNVSRSRFRIWGFMALAAAALAAVALYLAVAPDHLRSGKESWR